MRNRQKAPDKQKTPGFWNGFFLQMGIYAVMNALRIVVGVNILAKAGPYGNAVFTCDTILKPTDHSWQIFMLGLMVVYGLFSLVFFGIRFRKSEIIRGFFVGTLVAQTAAAVLLLWEGPTPIMGTCSGV
ncbi:MAG: hypothetical protein FWH04_04620 [Oscillospiraceae bacterium]|nr:hypothetical protein [Oscillospiraceae bacterium]